MSTDRQAPTSASWRERLTTDERAFGGAYRRRWHGAVHEAFGLSSSSYLVVPRLVLCSMPLTWQEAAVALLHDLYHELGTDWEPAGGYGVHAKVLRGKYVRDPFADYRHGNLLWPRCYGARPANPFLRTPA